MEDDNISTNRRNLLKAFGAGSAAVSLAGCNDKNSTGGKNSSGKDGSTEGNSSSTASPDQAPEILSQSAHPKNNGEALSVSMEAEDNENIEYALIQYGDRINERNNVDGKKIDMNGEFTDLTGARLGEDPSRVVYLARDNQGRETRVEVSPDEIAPELLDFAVSPTNKAGQMSLGVKGKDNIGLEQLALLLDGNSQLRQDASGQKEAAVDTNINVSSNEAVGEENNLKAILEDWNGNTVESEAEAYVRRYDVMEDTNMDVGAVYLPWMGSKFGETLSNEANPRVGDYEDLTKEQNELVSQQVDQMQGHGVNNVMFTFGEYRDHQRFQNFEEAGLTDEIGIEAFVAIPPIFNRDRDIDEDLDFIHENLLHKDNYNQVNERPVVQFWNPSHLVYNRREEIQSTYGGLTEFIGHVRESLTKDGVEPFLVGDANGRGYNQGRAGFEGAEEFWSQFDGLTSWTGRTAPNEEVSQEDAMEFVKKDYEVIDEFTNRNDQHFYPMVIPGFNDTHNEEWGQDRVIPRSTEAFRERLEMAENYADGRINVYSFNEWAEGSQIEPGSFLGDDYDTDYLEVIKEFQESR